MKNILLPLLLFMGIGAQAADYDVKNFGAIGDGKTLDHIAINRAIDSCVAHGGGRVVLPGGGTYLCGSIRMKSNVELHISAGATILAAPAEMSNCTFMYSSGLAFEEVDQGVMENIVVNNITMSHVHHYPIYITTGCRNRGPKERTTVSSGADIQISNVIANDVDSLAGIIITGMPGHPLRNIALSNIRIKYRGGGTADLAKREYREQSTHYPEPRFSGPTPAYGLYARHVDGLDINHVTFSTEKPDYRPAVILEDVRNESIIDLKAPEMK